MFCTDRSQKNYRWTINRWKNSQCLSPSWKCYHLLWLWWASIPPPPSLMTIIKNSCNRCGQGYSGKGTLTCWCHVGVWTRATTMEVSLKLPQKSKNRITSCITSGSITKRIQVSMPRRELDKLVHFHVTTPKLQTHRLPSPDALPSSLA